MEEGKQDWLLEDIELEDAYSGVVAPEAIRLGMFAAIHNSLKVIAADIGNAYLHAKTNEKLNTILGDDYGVRKSVGV